MSQQKQLHYRFYATLLDCFQGYLDSDKIWNRYWGSSENPPHTLEEFEQIQLQAVIDRINRVPFDSEAADRGTVFNEIVDCIIDWRQSDKVMTKHDKEKRIITGEYNGRSFTFSLDDIMSAAYRYKGAITQYFASGKLETKYGLVEVYGYLDELLPDKIVDIKTTGRPPEAFSFRDHWQHRVYPYCLNQEGIPVNTFDYDIYVLGSNNNVVGFSTETYSYNPAIDVPALVEICERMIEFIEANRDKITDKKIFNLQ